MHAALRFCVAYVSSLLASHSAKDVNIVLIGTSLVILGGITTSKAQPLLVLAALGRRGDLQYKMDLLQLSLRGATKATLR